MLSFLQTEKVLHHWVQYLSAFNNSYFPRQEDDSQSNLIWNADTASIETHWFHGHFFSLDLQELHLTFNREDTFSLIDKKPEQIYAWMRDKLSAHGLNGSQLQPQFSYELDAFDTTLFSAKDFSLSTLEQIIHHRSLSNAVLKEISTHYKRTSPIRIWPHHFDTGLLIGLAQDNDPFSKGYGLGYAPADTICHESYYYGSAFGLTRTGNHIGAGQWKTGDWEGAILPISAASPAKVSDFFSLFLQCWE